MKQTNLTCACGQFHIELVGEPIINTACHCDSCMAAAQRLSALPTPVAVADADRSTHFVLYRKDRVRFPDGTTPLQAFYLQTTSTTRRVLTGCCNSPVFLEFKGGHWLSLYGSLWPDGALPPLDLRTMTGGRTDVPRDVPSGPLATTRFYGRLLAAWIAMGFRDPKIEVGGRIEA